MCRTQLIRDLPEDDDDQDDDDDEDDDDDDEDDDDQDDDDQEADTDAEESVFSNIQVTRPKVSLEQLGNKLMNMGYTPADFLQFFFTGLNSENPEKYNEAFFEKMDDDISEIINGIIPLSSRDTRTYAEVAKSGTESLPKASMPPRPNSRKIEQLTTQQQVTQELQQLQAI